MVEVYKVIVIKNILKYSSCFNTSKVKESLLEARQGGVYILASGGKGKQGL